MKYILKRTLDGVIYELQLCHDSYVLGELEQEVQPEEAAKIQIPCKLIGGKYVQAEPPEITTWTETEHEQEAEPTIEERVAALETDAANDRAALKLLLTGVDSE